MSFDIFFCYQRVESIWMRVAIEYQAEIVFYYLTMKVG